MALLTSPALFGMEARAAHPLQIRQDESFKGEKVFEEILQKAIINDWNSLPIGECMGHVAMELLGTPYVGHTLELSKKKEICSVDLLGLDCVTFFEDVLDFSRMLILGGRSPAAMLQQVRLTRYRHGVMDGYTSRLHYTTDWIYDNVQKGVVEDLSRKLPHHELFTQQVGFMSTNPQDYIQLAANPDLVPIIKAYEEKINHRKMDFIPMKYVADIEPLLQTGDIVGISTTEPGIDIAHTGLIYKSKDGVAHFMDASSMRSEMKVTLEGPLHSSILWSKENTGVMIARPLDPKRSGSSIARH